LNRRDAPKTEGISMKKAMDIQLVVRPIVGCLMHTHFWEGPCRAGRREDMTPEAEQAFADRAFESAGKTLQEINAKVELLPAVDARYYEDFITPQSVFNQIDENVGTVDVFLTMNWRIPKLERYRKPVVILHNGNEGIDFAAYCRSIGVEAYVCLDMKDLNETLHLLWVRKAVANTRALVLTAGTQPTFGIQSLIRDPEIIRQKYGMEIVKMPFTSIMPYMDRVTDERARPIADRMIAGSSETKVNTDFFLNDIKYYLAAYDMMEAYGCNAFSTSCHELCTSEIPQDRKFTPCVCHSLMKDDGIPSGCEEDLNALLAMTILQYAANRPAFMGNPSFESEELILIHHAVPALCMNGFGTKPMEYKLWAFTGQGFGGKLQVDFTQNDSDFVTLARFSPLGDTISIKKGEVVRSEFQEIYCSPYYYIQMDNARAFMHQLAGFGHHQVLVFGDWTRMVKLLGEIMHFKVMEG